MWFNQDLNQLSGIRATLSIMMSVFLLTVSDVYGFVGVSPQQAEQAARVVEDVLSDTMAEKGRYFEFVFVWDDPSDGMYSVVDTDGDGMDYFSVEISGGALKSTSLPAFLLFLCHEAGHMLAEDERTQSGQKLLAAEGTADYFATQYCLPDVLQAMVIPQPSSTTASYMESNGVHQCHYHADPQLCHQMVMAAYEAASFLQHACGSFQVPSLDSHDITRVDSTLLEGYPSVQCRLDTYLRGIFDESPPSCWYAG